RCRRRTRARAHSPTRGRSTERASRGTEHPACLPLRLWARPIAALARLCRFRREEPAHVKRAPFSWWALTALIGCGSAAPRTEPEDPELVVFEGEVDNTFVLAGEPSQVVTHLRGTTRPLEGASRPSINLALVVDTSGSMTGAPIDDARRASLALLDA